MALVEAHGARYPQFVLDVSRMWPPLAQSREDKTFVRTVFGLPDALRSLRIFMGAGPGMRLLVCHGLLNCDLMGDGCLLRGLSGELANLVNVGVFVQTVRLNEPVDAPGCLEDHLGERGIRAVPYDTFSPALAAVFPNGCAPIRTLAANSR